MSKHKPDVGIDELKSFIKSVRIDVSGLDESAEAVKQLYKKFYAILILDFALQKSLSDGPKKTYAREAVSDISHGVFLSLIGLYKPARTSLRSGIENFVRLSLFLKGVDALKVKDVTKLFESANEAYKDDANQKNRIGSLRSIYVELCKTVHSTDEEYMNLNVPFASMLVYDRDKFKYNNKNAVECCKKMVQFLFVESADAVQGLHHSLRDTLFEAVPKAVKAEVRERRER